MSTEKPEFHETRKREEIPEAEWTALFKTFASDVCARARAFGIEHKIDPGSMADFLVASAGTLLASSCYPGAKPNDAAIAQYLHESVAALSKAVPKNAS